MKSLSTLFWIFVLHLFCILMPFGMQEFESKDMKTYTSKKDLENNFIAHWKNPEKYAAFKLNDETFPYASGLYALRPFYQKIKICTDEKDDYGIEYSSYDKNWRLITNPFYDPIVKNLNLKDNTIATLLEGESFSYANNNEEDILAYKTFENVNAKNIRAGKEIKKLKTEIEIKQQEIEYLKTTNDDLMTQSDKLNNRLICRKEMFIKIKQDYEIVEEEKKLAFLKRAEALDENENLQHELEKKYNETQKQKKEIEKLQTQIGGLSYDLNKMNEMEKEIENFKKENGNLKKDVDPLKTENKKLNHEIKRLNNQIKILQNRNNTLKDTSENELSKIGELMNGDSKQLLEVLEFAKSKQELEESFETVKDTINSLEEKGSEFLDASTTFKNMTQRYEILITQIEQKTLTEDIEKLEKMKNKNYSEEMNQLKQKLDLKRQLFEFSTKYHSSELTFLENEIELESILINLNKMRKKELTETENNETGEGRAIESKLKLHQKASDNHVEEMKSCREIYVKFQQNILDLEENYAKINQLF